VTVIDTVCCVFSYSQCGFQFSTHITVMYVHDHIGCCLYFSLTLSSVIGNSLIIQLAKFL